VEGAEWSVTPEVRDTLLYDDNRRLTQDDHETVWGNLLNAGADFSWRTERSTATVTPRVEARRFSAEKDLLDRDDRFLSGSFRHLTELSSLDLRAGLAYRGSLTTDLEATERTNINSDTRARDLSATWTRALTPRNTVQLSGSFRDVSYELAESSGLTDFDSASLVATGIHQLTERDRLSLAVFRSRYRSPRATTVTPGVATTQESQVTTTGFQLGWERELTETLSFSVSGGTRQSRTQSELLQAFDTARNVDVGGRRVRVESGRDTLDLTGGAVEVPPGLLFVGPGIFGVGLPGADFTAPEGTRVAVPGGTELRLSDVDETSDGLVIDASVSQTLETLSWNAAYSRNISPQSDGTLRERDDLSLALRKRLSPRHTGLVNARYYEDGGLDDDGGGNERQFLRLSAGLRWELTPYWSVSGRYQYRRNENPSTDAAESNAVLFTVAYSGDKTSWSR
jgi:hypothetical protein